MESETFTYLIADLQKKSSSRDPRHVRLSSVTAAIVDVINREGLEVNAPRVYSKAVVTLEGTLQKKHVEIAQIVDSVNTQSSLLELVHLILPMLESSTVSATFLPVSRAIRNLIDLIQSISTASAALNIKDDTGCIALVLATTAKTSSTLIKCASKSSKAIDEKHIKIFFRSTLRAFLASESQRVRRVAKDIIGDLLRMENPKCHPSILRDVNAHVLSVLDSVAAASDPAQKCAEMLGVLDLTRSNVAFLDPGIWQQLMFVLVSLLKRKSDSNPDFVMDGRGSSSFVFVINLLLSAVVNLMESSVDGDGVKEYSGRVLATLLQIEPILIFQGADHETSSAGRALIAQAILKGTSRVVDADSSKVAVFLPIAIGRLFELARDQGKSESETQLTQSWFLELTQILRVHLHALRARDSTSHAKCCLACLHVSKQVCSSTEHWVNQGALVCLAEVIIQVEPQAGPVEEAIKDLISRRCKVVGASPSALALEDAVHRVVQGLGIDKFWRLIDFPRLCFAMRTQTQNCSWLLKVMRLGGPPTGVGCASLAFFQNDIVPVIHDFDTAECNGDFNTRRQIVVELWSLLPCFCVRPNDIAASLPKLAPFLVRAMKEKKYPQLLISIPAAIGVLAENMNGKVVNTSDLSDQSKLAGTQHDDVAMRQFSEKILPTLFQLVEDLSYTNAAELGPMNGTTDASGEDIRSSQADALTHAIASIAKLASKEFIQNRLFTRVMHRLLEASQTQEDLSDKMCCLLTLSQALYTSKCLSEPSVVLLYRALRPLVGTDETGPRVQKRSYKLLAELCKSKSFITADGRLKEIVELLTSSTSSSQIAARAMRLRCIAEITDSLRGTPELDEWVLISLLGEILLCLKDSKNKTREAASALLISVSRAGDVLVLIRGIAAAVASETSHMRSAAITALSKIVLEHGRSDGRVQNLMPSLIQTVLLLSADPSREVSKSLIVFLRVAISTCPLEMIRTFLPAILESLLGYHKGKDRFRGKIEITMKKLLRLYGLNCLLALVTESECRSSNYLKKLAKSESKNKKSRKGSIREKSVDEMMASDEEDSDEELTSTRVARGRDQQDRSRKRGYPEEDEGIARFNRQVLIRNNSIVGFEVKDLASSVRQHCLESDSDNDDVITFDERGRLIISSRSNDAQQREEDHAGTLATSSNSKKPGTSVHAGHHQTSKKLGDAYMSKKAGGDVRRKGQKFDPYAYVPLDGKSYTKKNRRHAVEQLDTVVRGRKRQKR